MTHLKSICRATHKMKPPDFAQAAWDLLKIFRNISIIIVLLSYMDNDGAILLLDSISDLISGLNTLESCLVMLDFFFIDLQRTLSAITHFWLLCENQCLKNTRSFNTLHSNTYFWYNILRQKC